MVIYKTVTFNDVFITIVSSVLILRFNEMAERLRKRRLKTTTVKLEVTIHTFV